MKILRPARYALPSLLALATVIPLPASGQEWPARTLQIVVPFPPGGSPDTTGRLLAERLPRLVGQSVVVINRPGGGGVLGAQTVASAKPDGHTLLIGALALALSPSLRKDMPYDTAKDLEPVALVARQPGVLAIHPGVPANTLKDLMELARAKPGVLNYASSGEGTGNHLVTELLLSRAGASMQHIPYQGGGSIYGDVLTGRVQVIINTAVSSIQLVQSGQLRALGVLNTKRLTQLPDVPTFAEAGFPGFDEYTINGVLTTGGTPAGIVTRLNGAIGKAMADPSMQAALAKIGAEVAMSSPREYRTILENETAKWAKVIKAIGLQPQ